MRDLLSRVATEEDEDYTLQPGNRYKTHHLDKDGPRKRPKRNGYETVDVQMDDDDEVDAAASTVDLDALDATFNDTTDPSVYIDAYTHIKNEIRRIQHNINEVNRLRGAYNRSDTQNKYESVMRQLDDIMSQNSVLCGQIKQTLKAEKEKNDKLSSGGDNHSSSILQWRVNQLNSCALQFKRQMRAFGESLNETRNCMNEKERRKLREFDEKHELTDDKIESMVSNPEHLSAFLKNKFEGMAASDALLERVQEIEDQHRGMLKIEKSIKELQESFLELNIMITEQQELLDGIESNVEQTKSYMEKATKNLNSAQKKQKCSRKLGCCALCMLLVIVIVVVIFAGGFMKFYF